MDRIEELLGRINFDAPGLEEAGKAYAAGDKKAAMDHIVTHFRTRKSPRYLFNREDCARLKDDGLIADAEEVMQHTIYGHHFDGDIDWFFNPTTETSRDNEWTWSLYRHIYWQPLARAYALTGDEKYTAEFLHQMNSFMDAWPVAPFMENEEDAAAKYKFPGHAWRTIETAMRLYTSWLPCMEVFRTSTQWGAQDWARFLLAVCDHADFLMTHYSNHKKSSNWLTMESGSLLECGILFPEIRSDWFITGYRRVMHEVKYSFDNDGIHMERTPIYHMVAAGGYLQCYRLCVANDIPVPPYMLPTLTKSAEFLMSLVKPDLSTPMIGDADRVDLTTRRCDTSLYEGMNLTFDPEDLNEFRAYFRIMADITGRDDFRFMASAGKEGTPPAQRDYRYTDAGIYVMRTGWESKDSYFHMHGIQLERGEVSSHSHNDTCHVELHIGGEDILTDSGRYIYNSSCWKDLRHYFLSAKAHNTLYIDDHEMGTVPGVTRTRGVRTYCHAFIDDGRIQLIDLSHNGYAFLDDPIFHRRRVLHLPGDVYVIEDRVTGLGLEDHDIRLYDNFAFGALEKAAGDDQGSFLYTSQSGQRFNVDVRADKEISCDMLEGSEDPIGGWISYGYAWRKPIPQLIISHRGRAPISFLTVLSREAKAPEVTRRGDGWELKTKDGVTALFTDEEVSCS